MFVCNAFSVPPCLAMPFLALPCLALPCLALRLAQPQLGGDESGLVYARPTAVDYDTSVPQQGSLSGGSYCDGDAFEVTTALISEGLEVTINIYSYIYYI